MTSTSTSTFPLETLPTELQCAIICFLDPIALVSLSQTNTHFRHLIDPSRTHFTERLLALECREAEGGPQINFSRWGTLDPDRNSPQWEANRWACTSCLKLLPHCAFDNWALSRIGYRKPIQGSGIAEACTTWEPTENARRAAQSAKFLALMHRDPALRKRYAISTTCNWGRYRPTPPHGMSPNIELMQRHLNFQEEGIEEVQGMTFSEFEKASEDGIFARDARAVEVLRAGANRHVRRCIECRFRRGEFRGSAGRGRGIGTTRVPIVVGRQKSFGTVIDRYFPGVSDVLENKRPDVKAPVFTIYRQDSLDKPWTLYRVRCPNCEKWKELRAFRVGGVWPRWKPVDLSDTAMHGDVYQNWDGTGVTEGSLNSLCCNHCFVQKHGREKLGAELARWFAHLIDIELVNAGSNLLSGFRGLQDSSLHAERSIKNRIKALLWDMKHLFDKRSDLSATDVALLRQRRALWIAAGDLSPSWKRPNKWHVEWVRYYDESEVMWYWLKACKEEVQEEGIGSRLVEWALGRDEAAASGVSKNLIV
ncbi:F-box protein [Aspergillus mulundensis]|uniref:F-box domain-containing protein n=1 Tax=Aspergillus mulundensis TaxID=1810919 RepID=A0A3D8SI81_9EURO|nr:hypothetical protein DSM5745_02707 [Aspergillus mulundensis]RDW86065.1 hypothetical protein DSM5745_02707 [Aspergillus mulundensis]